MSDLKQPEGCGINLTLATQQNLTQERVDAIAQVHKQLDELLHRPAMFCEAPQEAVKLVESYEFVLQGLWNFPYSWSHHTYWIRFKDCCCPPMDNAELFGVGYRIFSEQCPYHSNHSRAEDWDDTRFECSNGNF